MSTFLFRVRVFAAQGGGSVAILFALGALILIGFIGLAVDYGEINLASVRLQEAADSATLQAVIDHKNDSAGSARSSAVQAEVVKRFNASAAQDGYPISSEPVESSATSQNLSATLSYTAKAPAIFGPVFHIPFYSISGSSTASSTPPKYLDVYMLVDVSASMGVGATAADQLLMNQTMGCYLGCHAQGSLPQSDTEARQAGATLRIDVVQKALQQVVAAAQDTASSTTLQLALITFGDDVTVNAPLTSNLATISDAVNNLQLAGPGAGTSAGYALDYVQKMIPTAGDGSSAKKPLVYVILATDGVDDSVENLGNTGGGFLPNPNAYPPYTTMSAGPPFPYAVPDPEFNDTYMMLSGLDPSWCSGLKSKGANVMTLEMPYVVPTPATVPPAYGGELTDPRILYIASTLLPLIPSEMTACASQPSYHVSAAAPADIVSALQTLFSAAVAGTPRLTN